MRNLTVGICVSAILAGCGGGGGSSPTTPTNNTPTVTPTVVKDPLRIVTGTAYDAGDAGANPRWVIGDFNKDGLKDIFLRYDPESAFSDTNVSSGSPVRFFLAKNNGGFEQSTSIFPQGFSPILVNRIVANDFNGDGGTDILITTAGQDPYVNGVAQSTGHTGAYATVLNYSPNGYTVAKVSNNPLMWGHHASVGDIDGDYLPDAIISSIMISEPFLIMGDGNGSYKADTTRFAPNTFKWPKNVLERFGNNSIKKWESSLYTSTAMIDANGDGRMDIAMMAINGTKTSVVYLNDGSGHFSNDNVIELPAGPNGYGYGYFLSQSDNKTVQVGDIHLDTLVADVNNDGKPDIVSLTTYGNTDPNNYVYYRGAAIQILINTGKGFVDETKTRSNFKHAPDVNFSQYDTIEYSDINNDKCKDILLHRSQQINNMDNALPTRILINDCKGNFTEKAYPKSLPVGILTVLGDGHYAILISNKSNAKYTQRVDDVYYDWSLNQSLFP